MQMLLVVEVSIPFFLLVYFLLRLFWLVTVIALGSDCWATPDDAKTKTTDSDWTGCFHYLTRQMDTSWLLLSLYLWLRAVFIWVSKVIPSFLWCCFITLCDWLTKLVPHSQPIRNKTKPIGDLLASVFARLAPATPVFALNSDWFIAPFASPVIGQSTNSSSGLTTLNWNHSNDIQYKILIPIKLPYLDNVCRCRNIHPDKCSCMNQCCLCIPLSRGTCYDRIFGIHQRLFVDRIWIVKMESKVRKLENYNRSIFRSCLFRHHDAKRI